MSKRAQQLIIKQYQPVRFWALRIVYGIVLCLAGWGLYGVGQDSAGYNNAELAGNAEKLKEYIRSLEGQKEKLLEQVAVVERNRQVETQAFSDVDSSLKGLQEEILELKQEVAFYRGIVAPRESEGGLNIQSFRIEKAAEDNSFRFKLVLTQVAKSDSAVKGRLKIEIAGVKDGKALNLPLSDVSGGAVPNLDLRFKYFQTFEGNMVLPAGFGPTHVVIEIIPASGRSGFSKNFAWEASLS